MRFKLYYFRDVLKRVPDKHFYHQDIDSAIKEADRLKEIGDRREFSNTTQFIIIDGVKERIVQLY